MLTFFKTTTCKPQRARASDCRGALSPREPLPDTRLTQAPPRLAHPHEAHTGAPSFTGAARRPLILMFSTSTQTEKAIAKLMSLLGMWTCAASATMLVPMISRKPAPAF
jgi:hypothetical protein